MQIQAVKGMRDLLGEEMSKFRFLEEQAREIFTRYGFQEIRTPIVEFTELFTHSVGVDTDIVGKEMYLIQDTKGESMALRPEGTASVVRSMIQHNILRHSRNAKYYYFGPMFRHERPQKGRFRQFHQVGLETFGSDSPDVDLEILLLLRSYLESVHFENFSVQLNSIGCQKEDCRPNFKKKLLTYLESKEDQLCDDCKRRKNNNPLRVLDCKNEKCIQATEDAPKIHEEICRDCADHFSQLIELLQLHGIAYQLDHKLVRGLDYYTRTVFEIHAANLGAKSAVGGGGRYDGLFEILGSSPVPAIGVALGLDRLAMLIEAPQSTSPSLFVVGQDMISISQIVEECRQAGYICHYDSHRSSIKSQMRQANRLEAKVVLILGEKELESNEVSIKDMNNNTQETWARTSYLAELKKILA